VVEVVFQSAFRFEMNQNNVFSFLTAHQNNPKSPKKINLKQKKIQKHGWD